MTTTDGRHMTEEAERKGKMQKSKIIYITGMTERMRASNLLPIGVCYRYYCRYQRLVLVCLYQLIGFGVLFRWLWRCFSIS